MITTPSPDRTSVQLGHEEIALDARHVRSCPRALVYAGRNEPTTDETPADQQNGLAIQRALAEPTVDALVREGWEMKWVRRSGQLHDPSVHTNWAPLKGVRVHGLPDALGRGEATGWQAAPVVSVSGPRMRDPYSEWCSAAAHTHNQGLPEGSPLGDRIAEPGDRAARHEGPGAGGSEVAGRPYTPGTGEAGGCRPAGNSARAPEQRGRPGVPGLPLEERMPAPEDPEPLRDQGAGQRRNT